MAGAFDYRATASTVGYAPVGGSVLALNGPTIITEGTQEYLRTGNVKAYDSSYADAIAAAPQLRVFGTPANSYYSSSYTASYSPTIAYSASTYATGAGMSGAAGYIGTSLSLLSTSSTASVINPGSGAFVYPLYSSTYIVIAKAVDTAPTYSTDGGATSAGSVGGTFTICPVKTAGIFANNTWLMLSSLNATSGEQCYIASANPTGAWTVGASTNIGMTLVKSISYGGGVFVAVGVNASSATAGKIATTASAGSAWTDRTAGAGITFVTADSVYGSCFSGTNHVALYGTSSTTTKAMISPDGINWTAKTLPIVCDTTVSDGAGTVIAYYGAGAPSATLSTGVSFALSTDNGATWTIANVYKGTCPVVGVGAKRIWFVNNKWIVFHTGDPHNFVDLGASISTPNYIGQQTTLPDDVLTGSGYYVRIK